METKGIPIAMMTAHMDAPLVIARRTPGLRGLGGEIISPGARGRSRPWPWPRQQRVLIVDDFMKGGGTLQGMVDMMGEFQAQVVGVGVMIATAQPQQKKVKGAKSLLLLDPSGPNRGVERVTPSDIY